MSAEAEPADSGPRERCELSFSWNSQWADKCWIRERERDKEKDKERERDREVDPGLTNSPMGVSSQNNALRGGAVKKSGGVNAKPVRELNGWVVVKLTVGTGGRQQI